MQIIESLKKNRKTLILVLLMGIILCFMGFYNNYPLLYWDSVTYISSGFWFYVPRDRPIIYGFFVRGTSLNYTLWLTMISQGIILSLTVFYYFKYLCTAYKNYLPFILFIFLITFFTGASVHASIILPDIFTSIAILSLGLLIFVRYIKKRDFIIISLLLMLSISVHNSHFAIIVLLMLIMTVSILFRKIRSLISFFKIKRLIYIWALIVTTFLLSSLVHYIQPRSSENIKGGDFSASRGGPFFLMTRLNDMGILKNYLDENCKKYDYKICEYKDSIPSGLDFLWEKKVSPLYKTGGWHKNKKEYSLIIKDILTTPKYLKTFIIKNIESSFAQFFSFDVIDNTPPIPNDTYFGSVINDCYDSYRYEYTVSRQYKYQLDHTFINYSQTILFCLSLFFSLIILLSKVPLKYKLLIVYILVALFMNAAVCSSFSMIVPRYQSRVIWLLILPVVLTFSDKDVIKSFAADVLKKIKNIPRI